MIDIRKRIEFYNLYKTNVNPLDIYISFSYIDLLVFYGVIDWIFRILPTPYYCLFRTISFTLYLASTCITLVSSIGLLNHCTCSYRTDFIVRNIDTRNYIDMTDWGCRNSSLNLLISLYSLVAFSTFYLISNDQKYKDNIWWTLVG